MCILGTMINGLIQQEIGEDGVLTLVQFSQYGDGWAYNFNLANTTTENGWKYNNEQMFEAVDTGLADFEPSNDGETSLSFTVELPSGAVIQHATKMELEVGEVRIDDDDDDDEASKQKREFTEVPFDEILKKLREAFEADITSQLDTPTKRCRCTGGCCKKKRE